MAEVEIRNLTRRHQEVVAGLPFAEVAETIVPAWEVSLVFVGPTKARELNQQLRGKSYTPNVLSYALSKKNGEIIICPNEAAKQASAHQMTKRDFILYLFIHGLLHLKGWAHGATMEQCERKLMAQFAPHTRASSHGATHSNRH